MADFFDRKTLLSLINHHPSPTDRAKQTHTEIDSLILLLYFFWLLPISSRDYITESNLPNDEHCLFFLFHSPFAFMLLYHCIALIVLLTVTINRMWSIHLRSIQRFEFSLLSKANRKPFLFKWFRLFGGPVSSPFAFKQ